MCHLLKVTRALKFHMHVPKSYWNDAVLTTYHLINRMPSTVLGGQIPYTVLSPNAPLFHLPPKIFGCVCYVHILGPRSDKLFLDPLNVFFLDILVLRKDIHVSLTLRRHFISADLKFDESQSYFSHLVASDSSPPCLPFLPPVSPIESTQKPL